MAHDQSLCLYPFVQMSTVPAGYFRPCCYFRGTLADGEGRQLTIKNDRLEDAWNCAKMRDVRRAMVNGEKVRGCGQCYDEEAVGQTSMRLRSFKEWEGHSDVMRAVSEAREKDYRVDEPIRYLELKPGYICNLKCRMCNQYDSVKVASELKELAEKLGAPHLKSRARILDGAEVSFELEEMPDWSEHKQIWESITRAIPYLETISLAGGEPTLLTEVHDFLRECVKSGHSKHMTVFLSSNFTNLSEELLELSQHFQLFEYIASIDGFGTIQEYIRFPSRWNVVSENFRRVKSLMQPGRLKTLVNLTLQMNNILHFTDLLDWIENLDESEPAFYQHPYALNIVYGPPYLSPFLLPPEGRGLALEKISEYRRRSRFLQRFPEMGERFDLIETKLRETPDPRWYKQTLLEFSRFTEIIDSHRKQSLTDVDPVLHAIVSTELKTLYGAELSAALEAIPKR